MKYLGSNLQLSNDMFPANKLTEIQVIQQHCGASTVCVFREMIPPNSKYFIFELPDNKLITDKMSFSCIIIKVS